MPWCEWLGKYLQIHLIGMFIYAEQTYVIDPKSDELSKLAKSKGLKCFKAADYTSSNDFVNASMIPLGLVYTPIHKRQKELDQKAVNLNHTQYLTERSRLTLRK